MINQKMKFKGFPEATTKVEIVPCPGCGSSGCRPLTQSMDYDYLTTGDVFTVVQCDGCGLLYVNPRPSLEEIDMIYPVHYSAYHFGEIKNSVIRKARTFMQMGKARKVLKCIPCLHPDSRIVDVGCGSPVLLRLLRDASPVRLKLYGNDFKREVCDQIRAEGFEAIPGNFEEMEWENDYFDVIVMNQVIEHLFDIPGVLQKAIRLLKPGGSLLIETPSADGLDACIFRKSHWGGYHIPRHLQIFTADTISVVLSKYGFVVDSVSYLPSPNFWTSSIRNMLMNVGCPRFVTKSLNHKNVLSMTLFTAIDLMTRSFMPTSNMRVIARKSS